MPDARRGIGDFGVWNTGTYWPEIALGNRGLVPGGGGAPIPARVCWESRKQVPVWRNLQLEPAAGARPYKVRPLKLLLTQVGTGTVVLSILKWSLVPI